MRKSGNLITSTRAVETICNFCAFIWREPILFYYFLGSLYRIVSHLWGGNYVLGRRRQNWCKKVWHTKNGTHICWMLAYTMKRKKKKNCKKRDVIAAINFPNQMTVYLWMRAYYEQMYASSFKSDSVKYKFVKDVM